MSENETAELGQAEDVATAVATPESPESPEYVYPVKVEDAGPGAKRISVEIPRDRIEEKLKEQYKELRQQAVIPGFRKNHAPQKLIEKRFSTDVKDQVRRTLIGESYEQAVKSNSLAVIGEPEFDNPDEIKIPDEGPLNYSFQVEIQPEFSLPPLTNLKVRKPRIEIKEENVDQAMINLREQQGVLVPVEDRGIEPRDYIVADIHVKLDGNILSHHHDAQLVARPGRLAGIEVNDLDKQLAGLKINETRSVQVKAPDNHPEEQFRGKELEVEVSAKEIKRLELVEITPAFLEEMGFETEAQLRDALREQMAEKIEFDVRQAMREQINRYLMETVQMQLPAKLSQKQSRRVLNRRAVDLLQRGVAQEQIEANIERLASGAEEEAGRELKLYFILQKIADDRQVDVSEGELNGRIAMLAMQRGERPEKLKQQMSKDGSLTQLYLQMREHKAIDEILAGAEIEEVDLKPQEQEMPMPAAEAGEAPKAESAPAGDPPTAT